MKYIIVGGVAGGATTAARLRRLDENAEIIMFEKGNHISYANCGLPYYIGEVIEDRSKLLVQTPESFNSRFNIDVRMKSEVTDIDKTAKTVTVQDQNGEYQESYDSLILSPGASPLIPPIPGIDNPNIFTLRNVTDTDKIKNFVDNNSPKRAAVIGAGFVGVEMAENLHERGVETTVIEAGDQVLAPLDFEMASILHQEFKSEGVGLLLNDPVVEFVDGDNGITIKLKSGRSVEADIVLLSIGVRPETKLAKSAGLELGPRGGILVDKHLKTSAEDIYALGDVIETKNPISGESGLSLLAGPANKQGRILANNLVLGRSHEWKGSISTAIAKVFNTTAVSTGLNEKSLKRVGMDYLTTTISSGSHAGYYPGASQMILKLIFTEDGKVLGAQAVGTKGVDKRIDMIAIVIGMGGSIYDLQEIEHAYAPPFSSAKDPVNQIAFNAENIINKMFTPISFRDIQNRDIEKTFLLDVRTEAEFELGAIDGAVNIPVDKLRDNLDKVPQGKDIYIYCAAGLRGYVASQILAAKGHSTFNLSAGIKLYNYATANQENALKSAKQTSCCEVKDVLDHAEFLDLSGLQCPGPIIKLKEKFDEIENDTAVKVKASDPGFYNDIQSWCNITGNRLIERDQKGGVVSATIMKGGVKMDNKIIDKGDNKTIVCFSDDMDKALASFVIANGAAATGKKVTMFFTFWGLNIIKKHDKPKVKKDFMGMMFGKMMPSNSSKLKLSNLNMGGMGSKMMKQRMRKKNVDMLEIMIDNAAKANINMIACQMSMDIMGVDKVELLDSVNIGGVANYLEEAEDSNVNLFI